MMSRSMLFSLNLLGFSKRAPQLCYGCRPHVSVFRAGFVKKIWGGQKSPKVQVLFNKIVHINVISYKRNCLKNALRQCTQGRLSGSFKQSKTTPESRLSARVRIIRWVRRRLITPSETEIPKSLWVLGEKSGIGLQLPASNPAEH